jgi:hypothetical protein
MNEAFNLYMQITYTTHPAVTGASTGLSDAASKYRFLGMGYSKRHVIARTVFLPMNVFSLAIVYCYTSCIDKEVDLLHAKENTSMFY